MNHTNQPKTQGKGKRTFPALASLFLVLGAMGIAAPTATACGTDAASAAAAGPACDSVSAAIAQILAATPKKACTTKESSCTFECQQGDYLYVSAYGGLFMSAGASCGGKSVSCSSILGGACNQHTTETVPASDPDGICSGSSTTSISCAAGPKTWA